MPFCGDLCVQQMPDVEQVRETVMRFLHALVYFAASAFIGLKAQEIAAGGDHLSGHQPL